jgi:phytoene synthase
MAMNGFLLTKAITKEYAKTFYFASRFLKKDNKSAAYAVYAICRISDEIVDNAAGGSPEQNLEKMEKNIAAAYNQPVLENAILSAFRQTVEKYKIPREYFRDLIAGMYLDLRKNRYKNFTELYDYCYKVAGVVSLTMLQIFGYKDQKAKDHAVDLGIAMQLTNILRDVKEDFERGRLYIPEDELARFGVTETDIRESRMNSNFEALFKFQIARAREYYAKSKSGIKMITDVNSRFVVLAMADIYSGILNSIEKNHYDIFSRRAHVSILGKITAALRIILKGEYR